MDHTSATQCMLLCSVDRVAVKQSISTVKWRVCDNVMIKEMTRDMFYLLKQHNSWQVERTLKDCHNHNNTHSTAARDIFHAHATQCTIHLILPAAPPHTALMSCHQHGAAVKTRAMAA